MVFIPGWSTLTKVIEKRYVASIRLLERTSTLGQAKEYCGRSERGLSGIELKWEVGR